jgi:hypothetical protein
LALPPAPAMSGWKTRRICRSAWCPTHRQDPWKSSGSNSSSVGGLQGSS